MKEAYLLDTNILIYASSGNTQARDFLTKLKQEFFFISVISYFEFLDGAKTKKELPKLERALQGLAPLDLRTEIVKEAILLDLSTKKKIKFKDLLIAATAKVEKLTLVTADKELAKLKGVQTLLFKGPLECFITAQVWWADLV